MLPIRTALPLFSLLLALFTVTEILCSPASAAASGAPQAVLALAAPAAATAAAGDGATDQAERLSDEPSLPDQFGISAEYGFTFDPSEADLTFLLARVFAICDYGSVWRQDRPKALRFKVEGAIGSTLTPSNDLMVSANMLALYYPGSIVGYSLRPYLEAGIGIIYTAFRVEGQGLHFNFNPLLGVGCELPQQDGKNPFAAIRLHHLSNAGIGDGNRGVNSVLLQIGRYF